VLQHGVEGFALGRHLSRLSLDRSPHCTQHGAKEGDHVARRVKEEATVLAGHRRLCTDLQLGS
jgi:hypothetical protein